MDFPTIIKKPKVNISPEILQELKAQVHEQGQVVVHCIQEINVPTLIRIWPTTYLYDQHSDHRSDLVHAVNISYFPEWKAVGYGEHSFTLIFSGLPKSCIVFDLIEHCDNESGAFKVMSITRTSSDVYYVRI